MMTSGVWVIVVKWVIFVIYDEKPVDVLMGARKG